MGYFKRDVCQTVAMYFIVLWMQDSHNSNFNVPIVFFILKKKHIQILAAWGWLYINLYNFLIEFLSHQKWGHFVPQLQVAGYNPATSQSRPHWGIPSSSDFAFDWAKHSGLKWCIYLHVFCIIKCCLNTYLSVDNICLWVKMSKPWCPRYPEIAGGWILIPLHRAIIGFDPWCFVLFCRHTSVVLRLCISAHPLRPALNKRKNGPPMASKRIWSTIRGFSMYLYIYIHQKCASYI